MVCVLCFDDSVIFKCKVGEGRMQLLMTHGCVRAHNLPVTENVMTFC